MKKTVNYEGKEYNVFQFKSNNYGKVNLIFVKQRYEDNGSLAVEPARHSRNRPKTATKSNPDL